VADVIPLFPLGHVLMPGLALPLHVFEQRYRQLLADVCETDGPRRFGVVALRRGGEVGNHWDQDEPDLMEVGTVAEILEIKRYDDGASDLLTVGSSRFRLVRTIRGAAPYLQAEVEWIDEVDGAVDPALLDGTLRLCKAYIDAFARRTGQRYDEELPRDPSLLSYQIAGRLPLPMPDRQRMLERATAAERLGLAAALLRRELRLLQATRSVPVSPGVLQLAAHRN
jgi:Lon protease-like protein